MNSKASCYDATMSFNSSFHEQLVDMTLKRQEKSQSEQTMLHDFDSNNETSDNKMISSINIIKISMLKQKNRTFRTQIYQFQTKIFRFRNFRNQYRQTTHQLRKKIDNFRTQLQQQQNDELLIDFDQEKHT